MIVRLHKILAQQGLGSRRELEALIDAGRVRINGRVAQVGEPYTVGDRVVVDGKDISARLRTIAVPQVLLYHKPQGQALKASADTATETVMQRLPASRGVRWVPINPMHPGDSGLLLLTNDGALSYALTRQKRTIPTAYAVRIHVPGQVAREVSIPLQLQFDDELIEFSNVTATGPKTGNSWYLVELARADRRAAVRALFVSQGYTVSRMVQVAFAGIELPKDLPRGRHRALDAAQLALLYQAAQLPLPQPPLPKKNRAQSMRAARSANNTRQIGAAKRHSRARVKKNF